MNLKNFTLTLSLLLYTLSTSSQDTFSIVAVDSITGEIGSAGASCVGFSMSYPHGAAVLSDVIPGIGGIHTQASYLPGNQNYAHDLMMAGCSPQQIIDSLVANDAGGNPVIRQYGIVDYNNGHPRSAAYTGVSCLDYKNDTAGPAYSIQGNILLGQIVIDSMQSRFLSTQGTLADRLMAALQGANMVGADTRCAPHNSSSLSSFLRVARPTDDPDSLYLDLWMAYSQNYLGFVPVDPIDSLQTLYDLWKLSVSVAPKNSFAPLKVWSTVAGEVIFDFSRCPDYYGMVINIYDLTGRLVVRAGVTSRLMTLRPFDSPVRGVCFYQVVEPDGGIVAKGKVLVR